jgi:hypothetical protein
VLYTKYKNGILPIVQMHPTLPIPHDNGERLVRTLVVCTERHRKYLLPAHGHSDKQLALFYLIKKIDIFCTSSSLHKKIFKGAVSID